MSQYFAVTKREKETFGRYLSPTVKVHREKGRKPSKREAAEKQPLIGHCTYTLGKKPNRKNKKQPDTKEI